MLLRAFPGLHWHTMCRLGHAHVSKHLLHCMMWRIDSSCASSLLCGLCWAQAWIRQVARHMTGARNSRASGMRSQQLQQEQQQQWQADRRIGMISIAMWIGTALRVLPFLNFWENMQSVVAISTSMCFLRAATAFC